MWCHKRQSLFRAWFSTRGDFTLPPGAFGHVWSSLAVTVPGVGEWAFLCF
jgi:hypothetical protein